MAVVAAIKAGEQLRIGALEDEATAQKRQPGLSIVLIQENGGKLVAYEPPKPMIDVTPSEGEPEPEPVPTASDTDLAEIIPIPKV
jgi:hypothetical protein